MLAVNTPQSIPLLWPFWAMAAFAGALAYGRRRRSNAISRAGMALGFLATPDEPLDLPDMHLCGCRGWYRYTFGPSKFKTYSVLRGTSAGFETIIFDYSYGSYEWHGARSFDPRGINQTVAAFHLPGAKMPDFQVSPTPTTLTETVRFAFSSTNYLTFKSHSEFMERYMATGADLASAEVLFTPGVLSFFERNEIGLLNVEGYSDWIIVYQPGNLVKPSNLGTFIDATTHVAAGLLGQVPRVTSS
jgi:hypothetical protein